MLTLSHHRLVMVTLILNVMKNISGSPPFYRKALASSNPMGRNMQLQSRLDEGRLVKTGHCVFQNRPLTMETGQYPHPPKEHIANENKSCTIGPLEIRGAGEGPAPPGVPIVAGPGKPGHKERD